MSRFIVTSGSDFKPFSYDELIKPVQASAEAHAAAADAYDQLSMETAALGNYISTDEGSGDVRARAMYDNYLQKLQNFQNNLWENGVTAATRRDMSAARAAYAQDITRLQKAIQDRQERSKEYWDARHKNPDLIMGFDPRNGGLDNYLDNSEYGRDWYSYSGTQFADEVGSEVKARAAELFELGAAGSGVPGYLLQIQKQGFTNADVDAANVLARQALSGQINLDDIKDSAPKLLANVLISRLQSTGINPGKNVSAEEFNRMLNYGSIGLAQGVGDTNKKLIEDKAWEQQQKYNLAAYQHRLNHPEVNAPQETAEDGYGYVLNGISEYRGSADLEKQNQLYGKGMYDYNKDGAIPVNYNGKDELIDSQEKAISIFDEIGRGDIMDAYGIDPNSKIVGRGGKFLEVTGTIKDRDGNDVPLRMRYVPLQPGQKKNFENSGWMQPSVKNGKVTFRYDPVAVEYYNEKTKEWKLDVAQTNSFNRKNRYYQEQRNNIQRQLPKGVDVNSLALVGDQKKKVYREDNIPENTPRDVAQAIHEVNSWQGKTTNSILGNFDTAKAVDYYAGAIREAHLKNKGKLSVASPLAFYRVDENGNYAKKGEINEASVFGTTGSASNPKTNYDGIVSVTVSPEDIYASRPRIRFVTEMGEFGTDPSYFGTGAEQVVDILRQPVVLSNGVNLDPEGIVHYLMLPFSDPVRVSKMSDAGMEQWKAIASQLIKRRAPKHADGSIASPQEILMDPNARAALRSAIGDFLNEEFSRDRDAHLQNGFKVTEKALPYIISPR